MQKSFCSELPDIPEEECTSAEEGEAIPKRYTLQPDAKNVS